ncbi:MAG: hypothetical protein FJ014_14550, partial [Chloroflexi bacterium]|nr:hypothetical protein [Chloroflexota bacterium]
MIDLRFLKTVPANLMSALSPYIRPLAPCLATPTTGYATPAQLASSRQPAVNPASRAIVPFTAVSRRVAPPQDIIWPAAQLAIRVPRGMPFSPAGALQLVSTLLGLRHVLALEIHSGEGRISYRLVVPWSAGQAARAAVLAVAPQAEIEVSQPSVRQGRPMALPLGSRSGLPWAPLPGLGNARGPDPLNPLLQSLAGLQRREEAVLQILIRPPSLDWSAAIHQAITVKSIPWGDLVDWRRWPLAPLNYALAEPQPRFDAQIDRLCQEKLNERLVEAVITLGIWSSAERARLIARTCAMALNSFATPLTSLGLLPQGCASPSELLASLLAHHFSVARGSARSRRLLVLTPGELAALWHLPSEATTAETVTWALPGSLMAPPQAVARSQSQYVILGAATRPEGRQPVLLPEADRRGPLLIIGKTGMGKTCLMENLVHQDVIGGRGVTLLDVHGDMTLRLLSRIPEPRIAQTVVIDTSAA